MTVLASSPRSRPHPDLVSGALAGTLGVAGLIHCLLMRDHFATSTIFGLGFLAAAATQIGLSALVLSRPRTWVYAAAVGASVLLMGLYAFNVAVGLPFHEARAESSAVADTHGTDDHHGTEPDHEEGGHGHEGLVVGAGEPIDTWGATTQAAQLASIGLALVLIRRRP